MFWRGRVLWARKDVPKDVRPIIRKTSLQQTLGTADLNKARVIFHDVMKRFEAMIANARAELAGQPKVFQSITINPEQFGISQDMMRAIYLSRPENQAVAATQRMERKLIEAGLAPPEREATSMDELFERWKRERQPKPNSENEYRRAKDLFVRTNGAKPIAEYTPAHARAYKDAVLGLNAPNGKPLGFSTRVKWFSSVKTLFKLADDNEFLTANPFAKINLDRPKGAKKNRREEWEVEELQTLFDSPVYAEHERPKGGAGEAAYWLPVLALYHGFRAGELCQLDKADVVKKSGIWCLSIRPSAEDAGKSVKTDTSIRVVPIHSAVIELGFLDYVRSVKGRKLFPRIKVDSIGRWAGNWSKWFGRYRNDIGLGARWRDFHSFRHGWKTAARGASIPKEIHDEITGHENGDVGSGYGKFPIPRLKEELEKIAFDVTIPKWKA
jgi:integrase